MTPSCFGLAAHDEAFSAEKDHLACVRLHFKGTRAVTIAYLSDVFAAIIKKRSLDPTKVKMSEVLGFQGMQKEDIVEFQAADASLVRYDWPLRGHLRTARRDCG